MRHFEEAGSLLKSFTQTYTISVFWLGLAAAVILRFGFHDQTVSLFGIFYTGMTEWDSIEDRDFSILGFISLLGLAGLGTMWLSSRLDFLEPEPDLFHLIAMRCVKLVILMWAFAFLIGLGPTMMSDPDFGKTFSLSDLPIALFNIVLGLVMLVVVGPFSVLWMIFPVICLGWVLGGALSLVRAVIFVFTRHNLRDTYERGQRRATFNAKAVGQHLGGKSTSQAHSRALLKDSVSLLDATKTKAATLNQELDGLSQKVQDDVQRLKIEAELSEMLAEIEATKIKIDALKKRAGGSHE